MGVPIFPRGISPFLIATHVFGILQWEKVGVCVCVCVRFRMEKDEWATMSGPFLPHIVSHLEIPPC